MARTQASTRWAAPLALLAFGAVHLRSFLGEDLPIFFDGHSHLARTWFVSRAFAEAEFPAWSFAWYGGYRLLVFDAPGYYWLSGLAALLAGEPLGPTRWIAFSGQLLAALGLYAFTVRLGARPLFAALAALLWVTCLPRAIVLGRNANYPTIFVYALLPWLLCWVAGYAARAGAARRLFAGQALLVSGMVLGHLANALLALPGFVACELQALRQRLSRRDFRQAARAALGSLALLPLLLAFVWIPFVRELGLVSLSLDTGWPLQPAGLRGLGVLAGLDPGDWMRHPYLRSHGRLWVALGLAGALLSLRPRQRSWRPAALGLAVAAASVALLDERASVGLAFFLYPLSAAALQALADLLAARRAMAGALVPALALGYALVAVSQDERPAARFEPADALALYTGIPSTPTASRSFDVTPSGISLDGFYGLSSASPYWSGRAIAFGGFPQGAPLGTQGLMALTSRLRLELRGAEPALSETSLDVLYLAHVGFLVDRSEEPALARLAPDAGRRVEEGLLQLAHASPALFAPRLVPLPRPLRKSGVLGALRAEWRRSPLPSPTVPSLDAVFRTGQRRDWLPLLPLLRGMRIERAEARAARIFSSESLAAPPGVEAGGAGFRVLEHREDRARALLLAQASHAGFVRLAYSHHPALEVRLDGAPVAAVPDALGALVLAFPAGRHTIELFAPTNPPAALYPSALLAAALLAWFALPGRARRTR